MTVLNGKGVAKGIAIGKITFFKREKIYISEFHSEDSRKENERFDEAAKLTLTQLDELYEKALEQVGSEDAQIFNIHKLILSDNDYEGSIRKYISDEHLSAEYAVALTSESLAAAFSTVESEYLRARAADIKDVSDRLLKNLMNIRFSTDDDSNDTVIFSDDLAPSETIGLDKSKVLAFCTALGSNTSHTAILARSMKIPAVCGLGSECLKSEYDGLRVIVDGNNGVIYIDPDEETVEIMTKRREDEIKREKLLTSLIGKENITLDGRKINVYANIGSIDELNDVIACDAGGIGLFRSEFLFLNGVLPKEESQFRCYKTVLKRMGNKPVIVRTADLGADKIPNFADYPKEENPALGYRSIRISLTEIEDFKVQLRALYRASVYGNLGIMFPMITSVSEIYAIKDIIRSVKKELSDKNIPYNDNVQLGIMIETPAAVMISDLLAKEVDFFSIGTNDLTQYTLAIDRQNTKLEKFCNPHHTAILRMIELTAKNAHKNNAWIGICGELSGDTSLTETFLAMGIDELSTSPANVLPLREKIRSVDVCPKHFLDEILM